MTSDPAKQAMLDTRTQSVVGKLKDIYDRGVQAYRDEDFKTAIDLLSTVVGVQVDYEQAGTTWTRQNRNRSCSISSKEALMRSIPRAKLGFHVAEVAYAVVILSGICFPS